MSPMSPAEPEIPRSGVPRAVRGAPPGWPVGVPPPDVAGWEDAATEWLLDQCPADYRLYEPLRRHPVALAWVAAQHVRAQVEAARECYRRARVELGNDLGARGVSEVLGVLEREGLRLRAAARSAELLDDALRGKRFVERL